MPPEHHRIPSLTLVGGNHGVTDTGTEGLDEQLDARGSHVGHVSERKERPVDRGADCLDTTADRTRLSGRVRIVLDERNRTIVDFRPDVLGPYVDVSQIAQNPVVLLNDPDVVPETNSRLGNLGGIVLITVASILAGRFVLGHTSEGLSDPVSVVVVSFAVVLGIGTLWLVVRFLTRTRFYSV